MARYIRDIPDFPVQGILFRDITPLLADHAALSRAVGELAGPFRAAGVTHVVGVEARGFIVGALVAAELGAGFVPVRKQGRLPSRTISRSYTLEYGQAVLEIHEDAFAGRDGARALFVDDVLATGGTAAAGIDLARRAGAGVAGAAFLIELAELGGRERLPGVEVHTLIRY
ncbi:MAG TPA: adenine phosphoribosyltransferase [Bacillota bacterium]